MSSFVDDISGTTCSRNADAFNEFFGELGTPPPSKSRKIPAQITIPSLNSVSNYSYCSSWVKDQNFCIETADTQPKSAEFSCSPLSEDVHDCVEFQRNLGKKRRKSGGMEHEFAVPTLPPPRKSSTFFQKLASAEKEIQEKSPNWKQIDGVWCEKMQEEDSPSSDGSISRYQEVMSLFEDNRRLFESVSFDYSYKFDWKRFTQNMQYVVFTKICQSHPPGEIVEMRKEDKKCSNCGSTDLAISVRLTVPLDLSETPIPFFEDIQIHVAFPVEKLLEESGWDSLEIFEKSVDFSKEKCQKMYNLYEMLMRGRQSAEYTQWFNKCQALIKKSLLSKRFFLTLGRVVRRKIEDTQETKKMRCFLFASIFNLEPV